MNPYYEHGGITIYHGDCREILPLVWFGVDAVVTDPPYGLGHRLHDGGTWSTNPIYDAVLEWDKAIDDDLIALVLRSAPKAIIWGGNYYNLPPTRAWLAWVKREAMPTLADFELAWTNLDRPAKSFVERRNPDGKREHPTQKPLSVMKWCMGFVPGSGIVLDPFMGSGTTLVAAKELGRAAIGIDREERYCEIAAKRLAQEVLPLEQSA